MRRLLILLTTVAAIWCVWWILGAFAIERGVASWLEERRAQGWQAQVAASDVSGFPQAWRTDVAGISLIQPATGLRIAAENVTVDVPTYWPFSAQLMLPTTPLTFETPQVAYFLKLQQGQVHAAVQPSLPVTLKKLMLTSNEWQLNTRQGNLLSAQALRATVVEDEVREQTYQLALDVNAFTPGDLLRDILGMSPEWPRAFDQFSADVSVQIDQASDSPTVLRQVDVQKMRLIWGQLDLNATGQVEISTQGLPTGTLTLLIKNWRELYDIIKMNPALKVEIPLQADLMLNGLANIGGDPNTLDLTLSFRDGTMFLGPIALGPAPIITF